MQSVLSPRKIPRVLSVTWPPKGGRRQGILLLLQRRWHAVAEAQPRSGGGDGGYVDAGGFVLDAEDVLPSHIVAFGV